METSRPESKHGHYNAPPAKCQTERKAVSKREFFLGVDLQAGVEPATGRNFLFPKPPSLLPALPLSNRRMHRIRCDEGMSRYRCTPLSALRRGACASSDMPNRTEGRVKKGVRL